jgi:glycerophosphoryl diester phosphodiesterase
MRRTIFYLLLVATTLFAVCAIKARPVPAHSYFADQGFLVIAHRGGRGLMPENTLAAFAHAKALGVDVLEMDLRASADGHLVIIHDASVDRTTNGRGRVDSLTLSQLRSLDAGYSWSSDGKTFPHRGQGLRIPTLDEVLAEHSNMRLLIEIKNNSPQVAQRFCETLQRFDMLDKTIVASFHGAALTAFHAACPQTPISATSGEVALFTLLHLFHLDAAYIEPPLAFQMPERLGPLQVVDPRFVESLHARHVQLHVWTVNREEAMRRLIDLGVDGLITDYPDRLLHVLKRRQPEKDA